MRFARSGRGVAALILLLLIAAAAGLRAPLAAALIPKIVGAATGTNVSFAHMELHASRARFTGLNVTSHAGQQIAYVPRVDLTYDLADLLPGSRHRFGLRSIVVYDPQITIVHNADGTYNIPEQSKKAVSPRQAAPLAFSARVLNGRVSVADYTRVHRDAQHLYLDAVNVDARVDTAAVTQYSASLAYREGSRRYPIAGNGTIDFASDSNVQHWSAARIPLPRIVDYAVNTPSVQMLGGALQGVDVRYFGTLAANARIRGVKIALASLRDPLRDGNGAIDVSGDAATTPGFTASLNGIPVRLSGGITDLSHPQLHFAISGRGDASHIVQAVPQTARLPMRGALDLALLAEGTPKDPLILISLRSPQIDYKGTLLRSPQALVAFDGREADVLRAQLGYRNVSLQARGRVALHAQPRAVEMLASVQGPSSSIPFAPSVLPGGTQINGSVLAYADDLKKIDTRGILAGTGPAQVTGLFHVSSAGVGTVAPLHIQAPGESLYADIAIDHPHGTTQALVDARNVSIQRDRASATISGDLLAVQHGRLLGMLGNVDVARARYGNIALNRASARFGGGVGDVRVSSLNAVGSFGRLDAAGTISGTNRIALEGRLRGSLGALSQIAGNLPANGQVDAPISLLYEGGRAIAQIDDARFSQASIRGVPLEGLSATIGTQGKALQIYAARANFAGGGRAIVTGAPAHDMAISVSHVNLAALGTAMPLRQGYAAAAARIRGSLQSPRVTGSVLLDGAAYKHIPIDAQAALAYSGDTLHLRDGVADLGPALIAVDGDVSGVRMGTPMQPTYDLNAVLRGVDAGSLTAMAAPSIARESIEGSVDANVHVGGAGRVLAVRGDVHAPEGSVHGLAFRDMSAHLDGTPQDLRVNAGKVSVGTTRIAFDAALASGGMQAAVDAPHANLADFNDYFDTGDTLAGNGRLAASIDSGPGRFASAGSVALDGVRYRRFELGRTSATWQTSGRTLALRAAVGGTAGRAQVHGTVTTAAVSTPAQLVRNATANLDARVSDLDLGTWLPMLGMNAPVTGKLNATAAVRGRFPDETIAADASLRDATMGRIPVRRAEVSLAATRGRGSVRRAILQIPYLTATGSGTFGLHANDPLDLALRADSPDVGSLMKTASGKQQNVAGALDSVASIQGTRANPRISDRLVLSNLRYNAFTVPRVSATIDASPSQIAIEDGLVQLQRGGVALSGSIPITMKPRIALDPANKPVHLTMDVRRVDLSSFESALPKGTRLAGTIAGAMHVNGTLDAPQLDGTVAMQNGYFVGPMDQNPISQMNGAVVFTGNSVALQAVHARAGGGTLAMSGYASFPNVRDIRAATFTATIAARGAQFNSPQYFRGKIDADVTASRARGAMPSLVGSVSVPSARIPLTAFWNPHAPKGPTRSLPPVALNIGASVGNDVRVQSSNVDVGAAGNVKVGGNLAAPTLQGSFTSTGGTVSFFRTFTVESADVRFDPSNGIMPYVNATATTSVPSPATYVAINVNGLAPSNMHISFDSDPQYSEQQIMGLLAGVGGPAGPAVAGAGDFSANSAVENLATGEVNTFFTREMLEPLSAQLGSALGLSNLQLTDDFHSGFGINAAKAFGKHITVVYDESLGQPQRQSLSIEAHRGQSSAFDLMLYSVQSPALLGFEQNNNLLGFDNGAGGLMTPTLGTSGTSFLYEHKF